MATEKYRIERPLPGIAREGKWNSDPEEARIFASWLEILNRAGVPFVLGGAFAVHAYTGVWRDTKDLDVFIEAKYVQPALDALGKEGFRTEVRAGHWLAKAHHDPFVIDLIFGIGNGQLRVNEDWFKNTLPADIAGVEVRLMPMEALLASKIYVATRDRFDGADVAHLIRGSRGRIDWNRILVYLGPHWELLFWQLVFFDFVYPGHADYLPRDLMALLFERIRERWNHAGDPMAFRGTLLDQFTFIVDVEDWGYKDLRNLEPLVDETGKLL